MLEALRLLGSLVICEDELPEPALANLVTMAGTGEARGAAGEASAMLKTLEAAHVERRLEKGESSNSILVFTSFEGGK